MYKLRLTRKQQKTINATQHDQYFNLVKLKNTLLFNDSGTEKHKY